jgi:hypothetical protein
MPVGNRHEYVLRLFRTDPGLLGTLIERTTGEEVPAFDRVVHGKEASHIDQPTEVFVDAVHVLYRGETPQLAVVVEMQHREVKKKLFDWPHFLFTARIEHQCPTVLVVVTVSAKTAAWARQPIYGGLGRSVVRPIVVCLDELETGIDLGTSLLFAVAEAATPNDLDQVANELADIPGDQALQYAEFLLTALQGTAAYETWRAIMLEDETLYKHAYAQELLAEGEKRGEKKGEARMIVRALERRGFTVSDRLRRKILSCQDQSQLDHWFDRAMVTDDVERLFSE